MEVTWRLLIVAVAVVTVTSFVTSFAYEKSVIPEWPIDVLSGTSVGDGFYQLAWDSEGDLQLVYLGVSGPHYAFIYGEMVDGQWTITPLSTVYYEHVGASLALDSQDRVYACTHCRDDVWFTSLGPSILFATNAGGAWEVQLINITDGTCDSAEVAVDADDNVHLFYTRNSYGYSDRPNSTLVDMVWSPDGWSNTTLKTVYSEYGGMYLMDLDERPDGSVGIIYKFFNGTRSEYPDKASLNYSVYSDGQLTDSVVLESVAGYWGPALSHDSVGNAHISAYDSQEDAYSICYFNNTGGDWTRTDVAYGGDFCAGRTGISVGSDDSVYIGYFVTDYDDNESESSHTVRFCTNADGDWKTHIIDDCRGWCGAESIALLPDDDGNIHIVYFQRVREEGRGDVSSAVYTTSAEDPDEDSAILAISATRAAIWGAIAAVALLACLLEQWTRRRKRERMERTGPH